MSNMWEGGPLEENIRRASAIVQDNKFREAMKLAHPELALGKPRNRPKLLRPLARGRDLREELALTDKLVTKANVEEIIRVVAKKARITPAQLCGRSRVHEIVVARHAVYYLLFRGGYAPADIGRIFHVDQSAVRHGIEAHRKRVKRLRPRELVDEE